MAEGGVSPEISTAPVVPPAETVPADNVGASPGVNNLGDLVQHVNDLQSADKKAKENLDSLTEESLATESTTEGNKLGQAEDPDAQAVAGAEQNPTPEAEAQTPQEAPKVPANLVNNPDYMKIVVNRYRQAEEQAKQRGGEIDRATINQVTKDSLSEYYNNSAKKDLEKGIKPDVNDKLYKEKMGEAVDEAIARGEELDPKKLSQEALARYKQEKDLQAEKPAEPQAEQKTTDQGMQEIQQKLSQLLENNGEQLKGTVSVQAKDLASLLKALAEAKEPDPKKNENKLLLLLKLMGLLVVSAVTETGKQIVPPLGGQR